MGEQRKHREFADLYVDLTYGLLLFVGIVAMIFFQQYLSAVMFGVGVMLSYAVHVAWRMARFDPVDEKVENVVEDKFEEIEETVEATVGDTVEKTVESSLGDE